MHIRLAGAALFTSAILWYSLMGSEFSNGPIRFLWSDTIPTEEEISGLNDQLWFRVFFGGKPDRQNAPNGRNMSEAVQEVASQIFYAEEGTLTARCSPNDLVRYARRANATQTMSQEALQEYHVLHPQPLLPVEAGTPRQPWAIGLAVNQRTHTLSINGYGTRLSKPIALTTVDCWKPGELGVDIRR